MSRLLLQMLYHFNSGNTKLSTVVLFFLSANLLRIFCSFVCNFTNKPDVLTKVKKSLAWAVKFLQTFLENLPILKMFQTYNRIVLERQSSKTLSVHVNKLVAKPFIAQKYFHYSLPLIYYKVIFLMIINLQKDCLWTLKFAKKGRNLVREGKYKLKNAEKSENRKKPKGQILLYC